MEKISPRVRNYILRKSCPNRSRGANETVSGIKIQFRPGLEFLQFTFGKVFHPCFEIPHGNRVVGQEILSPGKDIIIFVTVVCKHHIASVEGGTVVMVIRQVIPFAVRFEKIVNFLRNVVESDESRVRTTRLFQLAPIHPEGNLCAVGCIVFRAQLQLNTGASH